MTSGGYPRVVLPYPRTVTRTEDEETVFLTYPGKPLNVSKPKVTMPITSAVSTRARQIDTFKVEARLKAKPETIPKPETSIFTTPLTTPKGAAAITQMPKQSQRLRQQSAVINIPKISQRFKNPTSFSLGGGFDGPRGGGAFTGKWFEKKHKIKTPEAMLKTFGVKSPRGNALNFIDRAATRLDKPRKGRKRK
jgi:hypothetical protein